MLNNVTSVKHPLRRACDMSREIANSESEQVKRETSLSKFLNHLLWFSGRLKETESTAQT
jgi:hypothetical protein